MFWSLKDDWKFFFKLFETDFWERNGERAGLGQVWKDIIHFSYSF